MISALVSRVVILIFGTLYPAYSSYKAVKTKDIKLYVKWMMYWIVFALFTAAETFTDIFFSFWFPFYYELKIILVIWLLSPVTRGSSIMYRKVIHPLFMRREQEIDDMIAKAKDQGYNVILDIGCKGMTLATSAIMNTAVKNASIVSQSTFVKPKESKVDNTDGIVEQRVEKLSHPNEENVDMTDHSEFLETDEEYQTPRKRTRKGRKKAVSPAAKVRRSRRTQRGGSGLLFQLRKSYSLNDLNADDITSGGTKENELKRLKDCKENFHNSSKKEVNEMFPMGSQADFSFTDDTNIFYHQRSAIRKSSAESMALEKDCKDLTTAIRPRRNNRQVLVPLRENATLPSRRKTNKKRSI